MYFSVALISAAFRSCAWIFFGWCGNGAKISSVGGGFFVRSAREPKQRWSNEKMPFLRPAPRTSFRVCGGAPKEVILGCLLGWFSGFFLGVILRVLFLRFCGNWDFGWEAFCKPHVKNPFIFGRNRLEQKSQLSQKSKKLEVQNEPKNGPQNGLQNGPQNGAQIGLQNCLRPAGLNFLRGTF